MKHYHSDGAGELCGSEIRKYLNNLGCKTTWTTLATPQQNSISERHFRTEGEGAQAMLLYARFLPTGLWTFAKEAFTHVYNLFPTTTSNGWISLDYLPGSSSVQYTLIEELALNPEKDPSSYKEAVSRPDAERWREAISTELDNLKRNGVFVEVRRPTNLTKLIGCRYVFKTKMKNGKIDKYKARLVAKGYSQVYERDYNETFAPVARMNSIRIFLKMSVDAGHKRRSIDFTAAFLQADWP